MAPKKNTPTRRNISATKDDYGNYITLGSQRLSLRRHETDFSVILDPSAKKPPLAAGSRPLAFNMVRASAARPEELDRVMSAARVDNVAHHIYLVPETGEEIVIDNRIFLELEHEDEHRLSEAIRDFSLVAEGRIGQAHVLRVTEATQLNPLKTANKLAEQAGVRACQPQVMVPIQRQQPPVLFPEQWYLAADLISNADLLPDADVQASEAWQITTGDPAIVVAVIDDGFDLGHPALGGVRLHPDRRDFQGGDNDPSSEDLIVDGFNEGDYHGTPVSSIIVGTHQGSPMRGLAPNCTFLPIRIGFGPLAAPVDILDVFRYVSARADVVNCSFGTPPRSFDVFGSAFRNELSRIATTGGRRGKGLVIVFAAGNDDAPTRLRGVDNVNGVKFTSGSGISEIPAGFEVFSGYPLTDGVVVVAAMSSLKRKSGYSSWGPQITVAAPSNNMHYITSFVAPGADPRRAQFIANYRGLGQVAAANRPGHGAAFSPIRRFDDPNTPDLQENLFTKRFGGTSGATPVVTGVVALMLSVNPELTSSQVRQILMATADRDLDPTLDLVNDPNVQGLNGQFVNDRSLWFGSGKVNAFAAVSRAQALAGGGPTPGGPSQIVRQATPNLPIPDNRPAGVVSTIDIDVDGVLKAISVSVDITHTYRGDLRVLLVTPQGFVAELQRFEGGAAQDLKRTFTPSDTADLGRLLGGQVQVRGLWRLLVGDFLARDVGTLNSWGLQLQV